MQNRIQNKYLQYREEIVAVRRHLHAHPETGDREVETTEYLVERMEQCGLRVERTLPTGLTAILEPEPGSRKQGACVGLRADIDALPISELCDLPFRSQKEGVMHACGHDVHTAAAVGAALILSDPDIRPFLTAPVKFIFQPAEETDGGALRMIDAGCLESPDVDCMVSFHSEPSLPAGEIAVRSGYTRASSDMFDIRITGKSSHGAYPEDGVDAIAAASAVVSAIHTIVSRNINAFEPCVITIGKFQAGTAENIVCDEAVLSGTMRTVSPSVREHAMQRIREVASGTAQAFGARADVVFRPGYAALMNDPVVTGVLRSCAQQLIGGEHVHTMEQAMMSVDDFSFFAREVPSVYFFAGTGFPRRENAGLHHGAFEVNESVIDPAVPLVVMTALTLQRRRTQKKDDLTAAGSSF